MTTTLQDRTVWEPLVEALRLELQEYGGLLSLLDRQQEYIHRRDAEQLLKLDRSLQGEMQATADLRDRREQMVATLAGQLGYPADTALSSMLEAFDEVARPLLKALVEEINALIEKTRRRAHQNQALLARACDVMEEVLRTLRPQGLTKTYTARGAVDLRRAESGSCLHATG